MHFLGVRLVHVYEAYAMIDISRPLFKLLTDFVQVTNSGRVNSTAAIVFCLSEKDFSSLSSVKFPKVDLQFFKRVTLLHKLVCE